MPAPAASGWSGRRVGLAPTGKAPPCHGAHGKQTLATLSGSCWRSANRRAKSLLAVGSLLAIGKLLAKRSTCGGQSAGDQQIVNQRVYLRFYQQLYKKGLSRLHAARHTLPGLGVDDARALFEKETS
jgi:hypothetical protein